jgi:hypothetical protein
VRQFKDAHGVEWQVFLMTRGTHSVTREQQLPEHFRAGWLVFQSATEKRRFAPPPANWESLGDAELENLLARASPHTARGQPSPAKAEAPAMADAVAASRSDEPLRPQLRDLEHRIDESLGEVCEMPATAKLSTGELIRVEETLAIAAEAAKEAVSLRRRIRTDHERDHPDQGGQREFRG